MSRRPRRTHTAALNEKVALAAVEGDKTPAELAQQFDIHPNQCPPMKQRTRWWSKCHSTRAFHRVLVLICVFIVAGLWAAWAGNCLVEDNPQRSDLIVVLSGDREDVRFQHGLKLLRNGYANELVLDATDWVEYGRSSSDLASEYVRNVAPDQAGHLHVCTFVGDSTRLELSEISNCLLSVAPKAQKAIVVTSNFHTRRSLSVAQRVLPRYSWSVASAPDSDFDIAWWRKREWAKTMLTEWQKLLWWYLIDKWRIR